MQWRKVIPGVFCAVLALTALPGCDRAVDIIGDLIGSDGTDTAVMYDVSTAVLEQRLTFHSEGAPALAYSPDGQYLAATVNDDVVRIWNVQTGRTVQTIINSDQSSASARPAAAQTADGQPGAQLKSLCFSPDGQRILRIQNGNQLKVWDVATGEEVICITTPYEYSLLKCAFMPDGQQVATLGLDTIHVIVGMGDYTETNVQYLLTLKTWNISSGNLDQSIVCCATSRWTASHAAMSPDGRYVVTDNRSTNIVFDITDGSEVWNNPGIVLSQYVFTPDGEEVLGMATWTVRRIDLDTDEIRTIQNHSSDVVFFALCGTTGNAVSADENGELRVWNVSDGSIVASYTAPSGDLENAVVSPDGNRLAVGQNDGSVFVVDLSNGEIFTTLAAYGQQADALIGPNGQRIVTVNTEGLVTVWRRYDGRLLGSFSTGDTESNGLVSISPDGARLVTRHESSVNIWDLQSGNLIQNIPVSQLVRDVAVSADWTRLAIGKTENASHRVDIFDLGTGATLRRISLQNTNSDEWIDGNVHAVALNADGSQVLVGAYNDTTAYILDTSTGETLRSLNMTYDTHAFSTDAALTPDGNYAVAVCKYDKLLTVWDLTQSGEEIGQAWTVTLPGQPQTLAVSPDGRHVIVASWNTISYTTDDSNSRHNQTIMLLSGVPYLGIWDIESGAQVRALDPNSGGIGRLSVSESGRRFISAGNDQSIYVWKSRVPSVVGN